MNQLGFVSSKATILALHSKEITFFRLTSLSYSVKITPKNIDIAITFT
jgi:hypothetical protein